jgi:hypothetical protein
LQALGNDHFNCHPDEAGWAMVGTLEHYASLLKRITGSAFGEGEHARWSPVQPELLPRALCGSTPSATDFPQQGSAGRCPVSSGGFSSGFQTRIVSKTCMVIIPVSNAVSGIGRAYDSRMLALFQPEQMLGTHNKHVRITYTHASVSKEMKHEASRS